MQFMLIRKADAETEAGVMPSEELIRQTGDYMESMVKAGILIAGDGLSQSSRGARVKFNKGKPTIVDGPFAETKELVAGYTIIDVPALADALDWVRKWPVLDGHGDVEIEVRPFITAADFGEAFTPELQEREERIRQLAEAQAGKSS